MKVFIILRNYLIFLTLVTLPLFLYASVAFAESLDSYCIVQDHENRQSPQPHLDIFGPKNKRITFSTNGEQFHIAEFYRDGISLTRDGDEKHYTSASAEQYEFNGIDNLALNKNGWLWIDGNERDYFAYIDLNEMPPSITVPEEISNLRKEPCSHWGDFWGEFGCYPAQGVYSETLGRIFVQGFVPGYLKNHDRISLEIVDGKRRMMRRELWDLNFNFAEDIPQLDGVLFRGKSAEPLLYDGFTVTNLLKDYPIQYHKNIAPEQMKLQWSFKKASDSGRVFLVSNSAKKHPQFLLEINDDLTLTEISMRVAQPPDSSLSLFVFPNKKRLWAISKYGVLTDVDGQLRYVAIAKLSYIGGVAGGTYQTADGDVRFTVKKNDESLVYYSLIRSSPTDTCQTVLDINKPIMLGSE